MRIYNLKEKPEFIPKIAAGIYQEFIHNIRSDVSIEAIISNLEKRQSTDLPMTFVGIKDNVFAGTVSLVSNDLKKRSDLTPWLSALIVEKEFRNNGYGQLLIQKVIGTASSLGQKRLYLRTENASEYYKKLGWTKIDELVDENGIYTNVFVKNI